MAQGVEALSISRFCLTKSAPILMIGIQLKLT